MILCNRIRAQKPFNWSYAAPVTQPINVSYDSINTDTTIQDDIGMSHVQHVTNNPYKETGHNIDTYVYVPLLEGCNG